MKTFPFKIIEHATDIIFIDDSNKIIDFKNLFTEIENQ